MCLRDRLHRSSPRSGPPDRTGAPLWGRGRGVNDFIMFSSGATGANFGRRWRITAVDLVNRVLSLSSTAIDGAAALANDGTPSFFVLDGVSAAGSAFQDVDGEDVRGGYLCNPCTGTPFRIGLNLSLGPNFVTVYLVDDSGRTTVSQFTINYTTPSVSASAPQVFFTRMMVAPTFGQAQSFTAGQACTGPACYDLQAPVTMGTGANTFSVSAAAVLTVAGGGVDFTTSLTAGMAVRVGAVHAIVKRVNSATSAQLLVVTGAVPVALPLGTPITRHQMTSSFPDRVIGTYQGLRAEGVAFTDAASAAYDTTSGNRTPDLYLNGVNLTVSNIRPLADPELPAGFTRAFHFTYTVNVPQFGTLLVGPRPNVTVQSPSPAEYLIINAGMVTDGAYVTSGGMKAGDYIQVPLLNSGNRIRVQGVFQKSGGTDTCNGMALAVGQTCVRIPATVYSGGPGSTLTDAVRLAQDGVQTDAVRVVFDNVPSPYPETNVQNGFNTDRVAPSIGILGVSEGFTNVTASPQLTISDQNLAVDGDGNPSTGLTGFRLYEGVYVLQDPANPSKTVGKMNYDFSPRASPLPGSPSTCYPANFFKIDDPNSPTYYTGSVAGVSITPRAVFNGSANLVNQDGYYKGWKIKFITGNASLSGPESTITQYVGATRTITVSPAYTGLPAVADSFLLYDWDTPTSVASVVGTIFSSTQFSGTSNISASDNLYVGQEVTFTSGVDKGLAFTVTGYTNARRFTVTPGMATPPSPGDTFVVRTRGRLCQVNPLSFPQLTGLQLVNYTLGDNDNERGGYRFEVWTQDTAVPPNVAATSSAPLSMNFGVVLTPEQATVNDFVQIFANVDASCPPDRYGRSQSLIDCFMDPAFTTLQDNPTAVRGGGDLLNSFFDAFAFVLGAASSTSGGTAEVSTNPLALTALGGLQDLFPGLFNDGAADSDIVTFLNLLKNGIDRQIFRELPLITLGAIYDPDNDPRTADGIEAMAPDFRTLLSLDGGRFRVDATSSQDKSSSPFMRATPAVLDVLNFSDLRSTIDVINKLRVMDVAIVANGAATTEKRETLPLLYDLLEASVDLYDTTFYVDSVNGNSAFVYDANANGIAPEQGLGEVVCADSTYANWTSTNKDKITDCFCGVSGAPAYCVNSGNVIIDPSSASRALGRGLYILMNDACAAEGYNQAACNASVIYKDPSLKGVRTIVHEILAPDPSTGVSDLTALKEVITCSLEPYDDGSSSVRESPIARIVPTVAALVNQTGTRSGAQCTLGGQLKPAAITASYATCTSSTAGLRRVDDFRRMECRNTGTGAVEGTIRLAPGRAPADYCTTGELIFPDNDALSLLYPAMEYITDPVVLNQMTRIILQFPDTGDILNTLIAAHDQGNTKRIFTTVGQLFDLDQRGRRSQIPECGTPGAASSAPACRLAGNANADVIFDSVFDAVSSPRAPFHPAGSALGNCATTGRPPPCFVSAENTPIASLLDTLDELMVKNPPSCCTCMKPNGAGWIAPTPAQVTACQGLRGKDFDPQRSLWTLLTNYINDETGQSGRDAAVEMVPIMSSSHTGANSRAGDVLASSRRFVPGPRDPSNRWFSVANQATSGLLSDEGSSRPASGGQRYFSTYWQANGGQTFGWSAHWPPDRAFPSPVMCQNGKLWTGTDSANTTANCPTGLPEPYPANIPTVGDAGYMHPNGAGIPAGIRTHGRNPFDPFLCDNMNCCDGDGDVRCNQSGTECGGSGDPAGNTADCTNKGRFSQKLPNPYYGCSNSIVMGTARWQTDVFFAQPDAMPSTPVDCFDSPDLLRAFDEGMRASMGVDLGASLLGISLDFLLNANDLVSSVAGLPGYFPTTSITYKTFGAIAPLSVEQILQLFGALQGARTILTGGLSSLIRWDSEDFAANGENSQAPECSDFVAAESGNRMMSSDSKLRLSAVIDRTSALAPLITNEAFLTLKGLLVRLAGITNAVEATPANGLYQTNCDADCVDADCGTGQLMWGQGPAVLGLLLGIERMGFGTPAITNLFTSLELGPDRESLDSIFEVLGDFRATSPDLDPRLPVGKNAMDVLFDSVDNMMHPADGSTVPSDSQANPFKEPFLYPLFPAIYQMAGVRSRGNGYICNYTSAANGCTAQTAPYNNAAFAQVYSLGQFKPYNATTQTDGIFDCNPNGSGVCDPTANPDYIRITCTRNAVTGGTCVVGQEDGTSSNMTFNGTDKRSHTGHIYKIVKRLSDNQVVIDAQAIDDPGIIIQTTTLNRNVEFTVQSGQRASVVRAMRSIGRAIMNDYNQDPDIPGFDVLDLDSIIADLLRCDTEGLLLDTLSYYLDSNSTNGDMRRIRNAIFSLKPQPAVRDGMIDALGNLLGATGGVSYLGVQGRAPLSDLIPMLRSGALIDPTEQLALQRSVDDIVNPYNSESNARLNKKPVPATCLNGTDPSQCVAFADPLLDIFGLLNSTSAYVRSTGTEPVSAECPRSIGGLADPPNRNGGPNPCYNGGKTDFKSMLSKINGGSGISGLDVRKNGTGAGACTPASISPGTWTATPDGIADDCDGAGGVPDNYTDLVSSWDDAIPDYSLSRGTSDPFFGAGMAFWNRTSLPLQITSASFFQSGRAGNAGTVSDRRARAHVVIYNAEQPAGWSYTNLNGGGWTPAGNFFPAGNCDTDATAQAQYGTAACTAPVYARRTVDFYVRPRAGFQTVGIYPPVTMPAPGVGSATVAFVYIEQTGAEPIEIGLDTTGYFAPATQYSAPSSTPPQLTMFEVLQRNAVDVSFSAPAGPPDHMDMVSINGTNWKQIRNFPINGASVNAVPMIRLGYGLPQSRPQQSTDFEVGLPILKLLFNTPTLTTATNPQRLRPAEPIMDALLALLIPIDIKGQAGVVPVNCTLTPEVGDYVYLPRLGDSPYSLQTCQEAATGLGCQNPSNALDTIGNHDPNAPYPATLCSHTVRGMKPIDLDVGNDAANPNDNATPFELFVPLARRLMLTTYTDPDTTDSVSNDIILFDTLPFWNLIVTEVPPLSSREETLLGVGTMMSPVERILQAAKALTVASADPALPFVNFFPGVIGKTACGATSLLPVASSTVQAAPVPTASVFAGSGLSASNGAYVGWSLKVLTGVNAGQSRTVIAYTGATGTITLSSAMPAAMAAGNTFSLTSVSCVESIDLFDLVSTLTRVRTRTDMTTGISTTQSDMIRLLQDFSSAFFVAPKQPLSFTPSELSPRVTSTQTSTTVAVSDGFGAPAAVESCAEGNTSVAACKYLVSAAARKGQLPGVDPGGAASGGSSPMQDAVITVSRGTDPTQSALNALHFSAWNSAGKTKNGMLWYYLWNPPFSTPAGGNRPNTSEVAAPARTSYTVVAGDVLEYGILIPSTSHVRRMGVEIVFAGLRGALTGPFPINGSGKDGGIQSTDNCHYQTPTALPNTGDTYLNPFSPDNRLRFTSLSDRDRRCIEYLMLSYDFNADMQGIPDKTNLDLSDIAVDRWMIRQIPLVATGGVNQVSHGGLTIGETLAPVDTLSGVYFVFDASTDQSRGRAEAYLSFVRIVNGSQVKVNIYDGAATRQSGVELCDTTATYAANDTGCYPNAAVWTGLNEQTTASAAFATPSDAEYIRHGATLCPLADCPVGANISTAGALGKTVSRSAAGDRVEIQANNVNGQIKYPIRPSEMPISTEINMQIRCGDTSFAVNTGTSTTVFTANYLANTYYSSGSLVGQSVQFSTGANAAAGTRAVTAYNPATNQLTTAAFPAAGDAFQVVGLQCPNQTDPVSNDYMSRSGDSGPFTFSLRTRYAARPWEWRNSTPTAQDRPVFRNPAIDDPAVFNNTTAPASEPKEDDAFNLDMAIYDQYGSLFMTYSDPAAPAVAQSQPINAEYGILMPRMLKAEYTGWNGVGRSEVAQTVIATGDSKSIGSYLWSPGDYLEYEIYYPGVDGNLSTNENGKPNAPSVTIDMQSYLPKDGSNDFRSQSIFGMPAAPDAQYGYTMQRFSCNGNAGCTSPVIDHRTMDQNGVPGAPKVHFSSGSPVQQWGTTTPVPLGAVSPQPTQNFYFRRMPIPPGMQLSANDSNPRGNDNVADGAVGGNDPPVARASRMFLMAWRGTTATNTWSTSGTVHSYIRNIQIGSGNAAKKKVWDATQVVRISASPCNDWSGTRLPAAQISYCPANGLILSQPSGVLANSRVLILADSEYTGTAPNYNNGVLTNPAPTTPGTTELVFSSTAPGVATTTGARVRVVSNADKDPQLLFSAAPAAVDFRGGALVPLPDWNDETNCRLGRSSAKESCRFAQDNPATTAYASTTMRYLGAADSIVGANAAVGAARFCTNGTARCTAATDFSGDVNVTTAKVILNPPYVAGFTGGRYRAIYTMSPASGLHQVMVRVRTNAGNSCRSVACVANKVEPYAQLVPQFTWNVNAIPPPAPSKMEFANDYASATLDVFPTGSTINDLGLQARRSGAAGAAVAVSVNIINSGAESVSVSGTAITVNVLFSQTGTYVANLINNDPAAQDLVYATLVGTNAAMFGAAPGLPQVAGPAQLSTSGTVFATNLTAAATSDAPQLLKVKIYTQYDRPTVNRAVIDPAGVNNGIRFTARNAGDAGTGISVRISALKPDCVTALTAIDVVNKQILIPWALVSGQTATAIINMVNSNPDVSALVLAENNPPDTGVGTWVTAPTQPTGCTAYGAVLSPVNAGPGTGAGVPPGAPGTETTRRPWTNPIPVTFQIKSPKNAIRMRGLPQMPGAYLGLRMNSGIVRRPVVYYDKLATPADERDQLAAICLCGTTAGICTGVAPSCGATENAENTDGDNIVVLNQQAGFQPGDRIRIMRYGEATSSAASTVNKDFTAQVTAVTIVPDSAVPATYREWLELGDIRYLSQQCDMTSVTDNNAVPGIVTCAGAAVDVGSEQIVYVNPNTGNDDKFCFIDGAGGGGTYPKLTSSCQFDYSSGAPGGGTQNSDYTYLNCSSGNFDRGPDGAWNHVMLYSSVGADATNSDRYRTCMRNNYWPAASPGDLNTGLGSVGYWQTGAAASNQASNVDETGLSTQIGATRLDYGDNGTGITGAGNKQHFNFSILGILTLDADYNLVPGYINHDIMVPSRPGGQQPLVGRMGADFSGMMLMNLNVDGWFPGDSTNNHTVTTNLRTGVTDYSAMMWVNPYNSQICQTLIGGGVSSVCEPSPTGIVRDNVIMNSGGPDANVRSSDIVPWFTDPARIDLFARRVIGIPRRPMWAGGFNNVQTRIVRQGDGTSPAYLKASFSGATAAQNVWSRTGMFLAMSERSGETGGTNWREYYTSYLAANTTAEKMTIAASPLGVTEVPLSLPVFFKDVFYDGDSVLPSHMVSNYTYYNSMRHQSAEYD